MDKIQEKIRDFQKTTKAKELKKEISNENWIIVNVERAVTRNGRFERYIQLKNWISNNSGEVARAQNTESLLGDFERDQQRSKFENRTDAEQWTQDKISEIQVNLDEIKQRRRQEWEVEQEIILI